MKLTEFSAREKYDAKVEKCNNYIICYFYKFREIWRVIIDTIILIPNQIMANSTPKVKFHIKYL